MGFFGGEIPGIYMSQRKFNLVQVTLDRMCKKWRRRKVPVLFNVKLHHGARPGLSSTPDAAKLASYL